MTAENELILNWQQRGCKASRDAVVASHVGAIKKKAYSLPTPGGVEREDLISEGFLGLIAALDTFDVTRGVKFLTYGFTAAVNSMFDYIAKNSGRGRSYYGKSDGIEKLLYCVGGLDTTSHRAVEQFSKDKNIPMSDLMVFQAGRIISDEIDYLPSRGSLLKRISDEDVLTKAVRLLDTKCDKYDRAAVFSQITEDYTIGQIANSVGRTRQGMRNTYARAIGYLQEKLG